MKLAEENEWTKVGVDGGQVVRSFLKMGLLREIVISNVPVLLGEGRSLWGEWPNEDGKQDVWMEVIESKMIAAGTGCVQSTFRVR